MLILREPWRLPGTGSRYADTTLGRHSDTLGEKGRRADDWLARSGGGGGRRRASSAQEDLPDGLKDKSEQGGWCVGYVTKARLK